jgi:hypothetical protein
MRLLATSRRKPIFLLLCRKLFKGSEPNRNLTIDNQRDNMKVVLCNDGVCVPPKCPVVDVRSDKVIIGEKTNVCTLTRPQFEILRQKIIAGEI